MQMARWPNIYKWYCWWSQRKLDYFPLSTGNYWQCRTKTFIDQSAMETWKQYKPGAQFPVMSYLSRRFWGMRGPNCWQCPQYVVHLKVLKLYLTANAARVIVLLYSLTSSYMNCCQCLLFYLRHWHDETANIICQDCIYTAYVNNTPPLTPCRRHARGL